MTLTTIFILVYGTGLTLFALAMMEAGRRARRRWSQT